MKSNFEPIYWEPRIQIRHSSVIRYSIPSRPLVHGRNILNYRTYTGEITNTSKKKLTKAIDLMLQISPERMIYNPVIERMVSHTIAFITLTISSKEKHITPSEGHKLLLAKWLLRMKRKAGMHTYIWKAEYQKNGQLHYHITTPSFIPYYLIRDEWNAILSKAGMLQNFYTQYPGQTPNSTDVHKVYKIKNIQSYLVKYMSKKANDPTANTKTNQELPTICTKDFYIDEPLNELPASILHEVNPDLTTQLTEKKGKVWDCSLNLKQSKFHNDFESPEIAASLDQIDCFTGDFFSIHMLKDPISIMPPAYKVRYTEYLTHIQHLEDQQTALKEIDTLLELIE